MMCYLYRNPAPSSAMWHVLTCQYQGHLHVEIIPDVWCSIDYWSICHLFTNLTLTKCWSYCLCLGTHNSTLLCNWWWLNHSTESQTGSPIASSTQVFINACFLHQEVCKHINVHTHAHPNFRFSITIINIGNQTGHSNSTFLFIQNFPGRNECSASEAFWKNWT